MKFPRLPYAIPGAAFLGQVGVNAMWEGLTSQPFWNDIPWWLVNAFSFGMIFALLLTDVQSRSSWLRENWRSIRSPWKMSDISVIDRTDPDRSSLRARVAWTKDIKKPVVRVYGTALVGPKIGKRTLLFSLPLSDKHKDEHTWIDLGSIMISSSGWTPRHSVWGCDVGPECLKPNVFGITDKQNYLIEIDISGFTYVLEARRVGNSWHFVTYHDALRIVESA